MPRPKPITNTHGQMCMMLMVKVFARAGDGVTTGFDEQEMHTGPILTKGGGGVGGGGHHLTAVASSHGWPNICHKVS